jgi:hypothetical protein
MIEKHDILRAKDEMITANRVLNKLIFFWSQICCLASVPGVLRYPCIPGKLFLIKQFKITTTKFVFLNQPRLADTQYYCVVPGTLKCYHLTKTCRTSRTFQQLSEKYSFSIKPSGKDYICPDKNRNGSWC